MEEQAKTEVVITVRRNGSYLVEGPVRLVDADGNEYDLNGKTRFSLCRCGASANRPFCDGAHKRIGFAADDCALPSVESGV